MDESRPTYPGRDPCGMIDADSAPIAVGELGDKFAAPQRESSTIVYCGSAQEVSEGFAIALRAMGIANFLPWGIAPDTKNPNTENN